MIGRRAMIGLCMMCALIFSAIAAQGASAASNGTTAFTCIESSEGVGVKWSDAHCKTESATGKYRHVAVAENAETNVSVTNEVTSGVVSKPLLESKQAGVAEQLTAGKVSCVGCVLTNRKNESTGEHFVDATGKLKYTEVTVTKPSGKGCKVKGGEVTTKELTATTAGQGDAAKFTPVTPAIFAEFEIEGCSTEALNGLYKVEGSLIAEIAGATTKTTHAKVTEQGTLFVREQKAGLEGEITVNNIASGNPLAATTVATP
jgi:hypothetical protein